MGSMIKYTVLDSLALYTQISQSINKEEMSKYKGSDVNC